MRIEEDRECLHVTGNVNVNGRIGWLRAAILSANDGILINSESGARRQQPRIRVTATYWGRDRRTGAWLCRWLPVSTYRSTHRQTPNRLPRDANRKGRISVTRPDGIAL